MMSPLTNKSMVAGRVFAGNFIESKFGIAGGRVDAICGWSVARARASGSRNLSGVALVRPGAARLFGCERPFADLLDFRRNAGWIRVGDRSAGFCGTSPSVGRHFSAADQGDRRAADTRNVGDR